MRDRALRLCRGGTMREAQSARNCQSEQTPATGGFPMSFTQFSVDDGPHNMDGLRLYARDGTERVEAFIGRKVMDVWADSVEHRGGRQSLFRDQYNALGKQNLAAIQATSSASKPGYVIAQSCRLC